MAENSGFKHIALASDDEDDFVIRAGTRKAVTDVDDADDADVAVPVAIPAEASAAPVCDTGTDESAPRADAADSAAESTVQSRDRKRAPVSAKSQDYRATTLEDLSSESMPRLQKGILIIALIAVAAAIVYYFAFMR